MTDNATPKKRTYSRPTKYPAALPRTMTTEAQRAMLDERVARGDHDTNGEAIRSYVFHGMQLEDAYAADDRLEDDVIGMARDARVTEAEAIATMLRFAVTESRRRIERNKRIASELARSMAADGIPFDGLSVGTVDIALDD